MIDADSGCGGKEAFHSTSSVLERVRESETVCDGTLFMAKGEALWVCVGEIESSRGIMRTAPDCRRDDIRRRIGGGRDPSVRVVEDLMESWRRH